MKYWYVVVRPSDDVDIDATLLREHDLSFTVQPGRLSEHGWERPDPYFLGRNILVNEAGLHALGQLVESYGGTAVSTDIENVAEAAFQMGLELGTKRERLRLKKK